MSDLQRHVVKLVLFVFSVCAVLSIAFDVPVIYTICGFSAWAAFGHLITIDDEMPGGWANPENDKKVWRQSLAELSAKFALFILLVLIAALVPQSRVLGG